MFQKSSKYKIDEQDIISLTHSQDSDLQTPNFYFNSPIDINSQNQIENIENRPSLNNNNFLSSPLLIQQMIIYKEIEKIERQTKVTTNDLKTNENLEFLNKKQKKNIFNVDEYSSTINKEEINKLKNNLMCKKSSYGRKKKEDQTKRQHNKFSDDNIRRKCKHLVLQSVMEYINEKIKIMYNGNIGNHIFKKEFLTLNKNQKSDATIEYNQNFLNKTLGDILSENISARFTNYLPQHNKLLIERLLNENDEYKKNYFKKLFSLTFLQCLKHFREEAFIEEINGIKCFKQIKENLNDEQEYIEALDYYIKNFEKIINNKRARKSKKKRNENNN